MKQYNKPEIKELVIEIEDVIAASTQKTWESITDKADDSISDWFTR